MGVAMTVRPKWQFCILFNVRILQTLYSFYNTYHISSLMTVTGPSRCIYLPLQLLAKKALQVSKIYHKFKTKHFKENPHVEVVKKCILYPQQFYWSKHLSVLLKGLSNFSSFVFLCHPFIQNDLLVLNFCHFSVKFCSCRHCHCQVRAVQSALPANRHTQSKYCNPRTHRERQGLISIFII